jgi:hypothetical protein
LRSVVWSAVASSLRPEYSSRRHITKYLNVRLPWAYKTVFKITASEILISTFLHEKWGCKIS